MRQYAFPSSLSRYSATYTDATGKNWPIYMCSFGMGIERTVAAYVERYLRPGDSDQEMIWSWALAPFQIMILGTSPQALETYWWLKERGYRVLVDDRQVPFRQAMAEGLAFGFPMYLVFGEKSGAGEVKLICRRARFAEIVGLDVLLPTMLGPGCN